MAKILLVEDDNNLREIYEARLQAEGYTIVSAMDGEEALVVAKKERPDLVISDVMMPRISGFEMLDILRNTEGLKDVKIIMLTALGQAEDKTRADSLGADRYLVKSQVTLEDIVKAAQELLGPNDTAPSAPQATAAAAEQNAALAAAAAQSGSASASATPADQTTTSPVTVTPTTPSTPTASIPVVAPPAPVQPTPAATPPVAATPQTVAPAPVATGTPATPTVPVVTPEPTTTTTPDTPTEQPPAGIPTPATPPEPPVATPAPEPPTLPATQAEPATATQAPASTPAEPTAAPAATPPAADVPSAPELAPEAATPAAEPAPAVTPPTPSTPIPDPTQGAQSASAEEEAIKAQIESFVNQNSQTAPKPVGETVMADAIKDLVSDTAKPAPTLPAPKVITPSSQHPTTTTTPETPRTPDASESNSVAVAHKKIIKPITDNTEVRPVGLDELLAKEGITNLDEEGHPLAPGTSPTTNPALPAQPTTSGLPTTPHPPGHVISPNSSTGGVDPNSIAL